MYYGNIKLSIYHINTSKYILVIVKIWLGVVYNKICTL